MYHANASPNCPVTIFSILNDILYVARYFNRMQYAPTDVVSIHFMLWLMTLNKGLLLDD